jgi:hypothetical protein
MKTKFLLILVIVFGLGITNTNAQIRHRAQNQHQRIKQGVKSGEFTKAEAKNLRGNEKDIHHDIKDAKSDGKVTLTE